VPRPANFSVATSLLLFAAFHSNGFASVRINGGMNGLYSVNSNHCIAANAAGGIAPKSVAATGLTILNFTRGELRVQLCYRFGTGNYFIVPSVSKIVGRGYFRSY
jgi:hypothetical protein